MHLPTGSGDPARAGPSHCLGGGRTDTCRQERSRVSLSRGSGFRDRLPASGPPGVLHTPRSRPGPGPMQTRCFRALCSHPVGSPESWALGLAGREPTPPKEGARTGTPAWCTEGARARSAQEPRQGARARAQSGAPAQRFPEERAAGGKGPSGGSGGRVGRGSRGRAGPAKRRTRPSGLRRQRGAPQRRRGPGAAGPAGPGLSPRSPSGPGHEASPVSGRSSGTDLGVSVAQRHGAAREASAAGR